MNMTCQSSNLPWRRTLRTRLTLLLLIPLALLACSSDKAEDDDGDPLSCSLNTVFVGRQLENGAVVLRSESTPCGELNLEVALASVPNIFTVGFDITYPTGTFLFDSYTEGPLLKQGSPATPPLFNVTHDPATGRIQVFATRFNPDAGVSATSAAVLMTLSFRAVAPGEGPIVFDLATTPVEELILDSSGNPVTASFLNGTNLARVF
jgi:hypothetical protein